MVLLSVHRSTLYLCNLLTKGTHVQVLKLCKFLTDKMTTPVKYQKAFIHLIKSIKASFHYIGTFMLCFHPSRHHIYKFPSFLFFHRHVYALIFSMWYRDVVVLTVCKSLHISMNSLLPNCISVYIFLSNFKPWYQLIP